jgi:hypothetical protein
MYQTILANGGAPSLVVPQKMGARFTAVCASAQVILAPIPSCLAPTIPTSVSSIRALGNSLSAFWDKP